VEIRDSMAVEAWVGVPDLRTAGAAVQAVAAAVGGARGRVGRVGVLVETPEEGAVEISGRDLVSPSRPP
jgi:hypothetical protein